MTRRPHPARHLPGPRAIPHPSCVRAAHAAAAPLITATIAVQTGIGLGRTAVASGIATAGSMVVDFLLGADPLTPGDHVTRLRSSLIVAAVASGLVDAQRGRTARAALLAAAVALDGVDGVVARRTGTVTARGARFDIEADSAAAAVLCVSLVRSVGAGAVIPGALRYAFVAAGRLVPALSAELPSRQSTRAVGAVGMVGLSVAAWPTTPLRMRRALVAGVTVGLVASFARDTAWLLRQSETGSMHRRASRFPDSSS